MSKRIFVSCAPGDAEWIENDGDWALVSWLKRELGDDYTFTWAGLAFRKDPGESLEEIAGREIDGADAVLLLLGDRYLRENSSEKELSRIVARIEKRELQIVCVEVAPLSPAELDRLGAAHDAFRLGLTDLGGLVRQDLSASLEELQASNDKAKFERARDDLLQILRTSRSGTVTVVRRPEEELACYAPDFTDTTAAGTAAFERTAPGKEAEARLDENVQFTVFRPRAIVPAKWYPLLAFAHLSERPTDAEPDVPDPIEEVQRQAEQLLGEDRRKYQEITQDSSQAIPCAGELTFVPVIAGIEVNPPRRTFRWEESVHREEFRLRAGPEMEGKTARGRFTVFWGSIVVAELALTIRVAGKSAATNADRPFDKKSCSAYRKIFASYSHKDGVIVDQFEVYAQALGDRYLRDCIDLRAGEVWDARLANMIRGADLFQLFWSSNSMRSPFVRQEWEYALSLGRPSFVRPTYWEVPLPADPERHLPPEPLRKIHFQRISGDWISSLAVVSHDPDPDRAPASMKAFPEEELKDTELIASSGGHSAARATGKAMPKRGDSDEGLKGFPVAELAKQELAKQELLEVLLSRHLKKEEIEVLFSQYLKEKQFLRSEYRNMSSSPATGRSSSPISSSPAGPYLPQSNSSSLGGCIMACILLGSIALLLAAFFF